MKRGLLVFEMRMMGDAVMSLPFIRAAREQFDVGVCCAPGGREIFEMALPPERVIAWDPPWLRERQKNAPGRWLRSDWRDLVQRVRRCQANVAVSVWPDARTHLLMALSGAGERIGFPMTPVNYYANHLGWRKRQLWLGPLLSLAGSVCLLRPLLTRRLVRRNYIQHHLENWHQLAEALGTGWDASPPWLAPPEVSMPAEWQPWCDQARAAGRRIWLVHPGARMPNRRWPWDNYLRVIKETLLPAGCEVVVIKPPEMELDRSAAAAIRVVAPSSLGELIQLMSCVDHVLCNDTGVAHLAAALGRRTVTVFTANLPQWFAPHGSLDLAVDHHACPYRPCLDRCVMPSYVCCEAVTVEMVAAQVGKLL